MIVTEKPTEYDQRLFVEKVTGRLNTEDTCERIHERDGSGYRTVGFKCVFCGDTSAYRSTVRHLPLCKLSAETRLQKLLKKRKAP